MNQNIIMKSVQCGMTRSILKSAQIREEQISRLLSIFPNDKEDVKNHISDIVIKTYGLDWCYEIGLSGISWQQIKKDYL